MVNLSNNPFDENKLFNARSALVKTTPDKQGRFEFELWSQYTRLGLDSLQIGDLVAIENYSPPQNGLRTYSVLTLTQVYPVHFAAQGNDAYPGHVFESMRSIRDDWEKQSDKPLHPTTTITSNAVSTGWQFKYDPKNEILPHLSDEKNLPMVGAEVRPLSMQMVDTIINQGMGKQNLSPLKHKKFEDINIKLDKEALLTTHFGIFGFTGVGKSNLVSSMVNSLSTADSEKKSNVVIIDPNDEYLGLLIDKFVNTPEELQYIHVGTDSLPLLVTKNIGENVSEDPQQIIDLLFKQMKLPARLKNNIDIKDYFFNGLLNVLNRTRIALPAQDLASLIRNELYDQIDPRIGPAVREVIKDVATEWIDAVSGLSINAESVQRSIDVVEEFGSKVKAPLQRLQGPQQTNASSAIERTLRTLKKEQRGLSEVPSKSIISINELVKTLNNEENRQTVIITARRDSHLKRFSAILGNELYESRRREAILEPYTVFLFDEADLFIPLESGNEETAMVKELCVTLARRGRKFGLGIGISTQRAALLDTEVMGNLHTYFVSKLPRSLDRQRVAEAFGIGEEQLSPTFTFRPGNWLIISHDATGLKGVPIPTIADDANERILKAASGEN